MFSYSRCLLVTYWFLSMLSGVHLQDCSDEKRPAITSTVHEEVVFQTGAYGFFDGVLFIFVRRGATQLLRFDVRHDRLDSVRTFFKNSKNISVDVQFEGPEYIANIKITMRDVQESDSGDYTLSDIFRRHTVACWRLFVLGEGVRVPSTNYYDEGTVLNFTHLPHLSDEVVERMNITTHWSLDNTDLNDDNILTFDRSMNNKNLTYIIQDQNNTITATTYLIRVSYIGGITFAQEEDYYLRRGETIPPIRCVADCYPKCNISWIRGSDVISKTDVLDQIVIEHHVGEYECHVTSMSTVKQRRKSLFVYHKEGEVQEPNVVVFALAGLVAVLGLVTIFLVIHSCRHRLGCSACSLQRKPKPDAIEVGMDNAAANSTVVSNTEGYENLHITNTTGDVYESINTEGENYENMSNM